MKIARALHHSNTAKSLLVILMLMPLQSAVGATASPSWSCESERGVGLVFTQATDSWEALSIPNHNYILRPSAKFEGRYEAVLVNTGTSTQYFCEMMPNDWIFECTSFNDGMSEATFNTKTLKFRSHGFGSYIFKSDSDSVDYVAVGTCTELP